MYFHIFLCNPKERRTNFGDVCDVSPSFISKNSKKGERRGWLLHLTGTSFFNFQFEFKPIQFESNPSSFLANLSYAFLAIVIMPAALARTRSCPPRKSKTRLQPNVSEVRFTYAAMEVPRHWISQGIYFQLYSL